MRWLDWRFKIRALFQRARTRREVDEELAYHIDMRAKGYQARGLSPADARRAAFDRFGDFDRTRRECHGLRMVNPPTQGDSIVSTFLHDLRYGIRSLVKNPGFAAMVLITLALGIGANSAIYSVVDTVLLRPLPYPDADRLMVLQQSDRLNGTRFEGFSLPDYFDVKERSDAFQQIAAFQSPQVTITDPEAEPAIIATTVTTHQLFSLLGVTPVLGRPFVPDDDVIGAAPVAVLSHRLWTSRFGGQPDVVGRTVILDGVTTEVIGVMPEEFSFPAPNIDMWRPLALGPTSRPRGNHGFGVIARLGDGVSIDRANSDLTAIASALEQEYPEDNQNRGMWGHSLHDSLFGGVRTQLWVLMGTVGFVLLIACVNVANLLFARASVRDKEVAIRLALGASRPRLLQQFLTESVLLAVVGGLLGLGLAYGGVQLLMGLSPANLPRLGNVGIDGRVLMFTLAVSVLTGIAFGLLPALQATKTDMQAPLKEGGRSGGSALKQRLRKSLVVVEVGMAVVLVTGAGLLIKSFQRLMSVDPGFNPGSVVQVSLALPASRYPQGFSDWPNLPEVRTFQRDVLERVGGIPEVESAAIALNSPVSAGWTTRLAIDPLPPSPPADLEEVRIRTVSPSYFSTVGVQLISGRLLVDADDRTDAPPVIVVNESFVRRYFQNEDPIGYRVRNWGVDREIVGVVRDVRFRGLGNEVPPAVYPTFAQMPFSGFVLLARIRGTPEAAFGRIREQIWSLDRDLALSNMSTVEENLSATVAQPRFNVVLLSFFASVALVLAAVGIYGVIAFGVNRRTQEIGIRLSLGETRLHVLRRIVREGALLAVVGVVFGTAGSVALTRFLNSMLFEVNALDPVTFGAVGAFSVLVAVVASFVPAWRASRLNPVVALRREG